MMQRSKRRPIPAVINYKGVAVLNTNQPGRQPFEAFPYGQKFDTLDAARTWVDENVCQGCFETHEECTCLPDDHPCDMY